LSSLGLTTSQTSGIAG